MQKMNTANSGSVNTAGADHPNFVSTRKALTENHLIKLGKWAIFSMQLPGYLILGIGSTNNFNSKPGFGSLKQLQSIKLASYYTFYLFLWIFAGIIVNCYAGYWAYDTFSKFDKNKRIFSEFQDFIISTYTYVFMATAGSFLRIVFLIHHHKTLIFWRHMVDFLCDFESKGIFRDSIHFQSILKDVKKQTIIFWAIEAFLTIFIFVHIYLHHVIFTYEDQLILLIQYVLWTLTLLMVYGQVGFVVWVGFFIKIYVACFKSISDRIEDIIKQDKLTQSELKSAFSSIKLNFASVHNKQLCLPSQFSEEILDLLKLYESTCLAIEKFNEFYKFPIVVETLGSVSFLLTCIYSVNKLMFDIGRNTTEHNLLNGMKIPPNAFHMLRLCYLTTQSDQVIMEGMKVLRNLQKLPPHILSPNLHLQAKMQMLNIRVSMKPPAISPGQYFTLSRRFLASVLSLLGTYYLVLSELREKDLGRGIIRDLVHSC